MSFKKEDTSCTMRCWMIGAGVGLIGMLLLWFGPAHFLGALFWGIILGVATGLILNYLLCRGSDAHAGGNGGHAASDSAYGREDSGAGAFGAAAGVGAARDDSGAASSTDTDSVTADKSTGDAGTARQDSDAASFQGDTAEIKAEITDGTARAQQDSKPRQDSGASGFSSETKDAAETAPAADAPRENSDTASFDSDPHSVDYDGDGVIEGADEGTRPSALASAREGGPDDLKKIRGVGPKLESLLHDMGVFHFDQIASWTDQEVAWVNANLQGFRGRVSRDEWVEQAGLLASGEDTEFSKKVDKGGVY